MNSPANESPQAISQAEAEKIASEVRQLLKEGKEESAWERIQGLHPADLGSIVASLPRASRETILKVMSPETASWMLQQMNPVQAGRVATRIGSGMLGFMLSQMDPRDALKTLRLLPARQARRVAETLEQPLEDVSVLEQTLDTASNLMIDQFPRVGIDDQSEAALNSLRALQEIRYKFVDVFVTDKEGSLAGQISMVDLALAQDETPVREMTSPIVATVTPATSVAECARLSRHYNLTQLPVVADGRLVGVITAESLHSALVDENTRQMLQVANVSKDAAGAPLYASIRARLPWLTINLGTTFLAAGTVTLFESTLAQVVVLAAFLPVVAGQGGIGGTQTLTLIIRDIALGELVGVMAYRILLREAALGLLNGVWLGCLVAGIALAWKQNVGLALVLGLAMLGNMIIAGFVGAAVPLFLRRIGLDPAVSSAVVVTTFTDVFGFLLFLGIATAAISLIV